MLIKKILNNNFVITEENGVEKIVMGRGIAFNKKVNQKVEKNCIQKIFVNTNAEFEAKLSELVQSVPLEIFQVVEDVVQQYKTSLDKLVSESIYLSLADHLNFSLTRSKEEYTYKNVLIWDIQNFFPKEYQVGLFGLERMEILFKRQFPIEEAGFITLHLLNSDSGFAESGDIQKIIQIVQEVTDIVHYHFAIDFDTRSMNYQRLVTHVRFFAQRVVKGAGDQEHLDNSELIELIKDKYVETYRCILLIEKHITGKYHFPLSAEEKMYLTLHVQRIVESEKNKKIDGV